MMRWLYVSKTMNFVKDMVISKKIFIYLVVVLLVGVSLMISGKKNNLNTAAISTPVSNVDYTNEIDGHPEENIKNELINILKKVEGVGDVDIIINYGSTSEKVPLVETGTQSTGRIISSTDGSKSEPYIITEISPRIKGVVIVAQGGNNIDVSGTLKNAVSSYLDIPVHKVNVLKMK